MRPLLLVIRSGRREFREHLLQSIAQHYRVHLFAVTAPDWELPYLNGHTLFESSDVEPMISAAKDLQAGEHISGVLCWESFTLQAAELAAALGLPGDPAVIARCRDRVLVRQALAAAGVAQPAWAGVATLPDALVEAGRISYPVRLGSTRVDSAEALTLSFDYAAGLQLMEELVSGPIVTVDVAVHSGEIFPLCLARKEVGAYYVHAGDPLPHDPVLMRLLHDTHRALGFRDGVTHTEIAVSPDGPKVLDVKGRMGGDNISYLAYRATGVDVALAAAAVACGRPPLVEHDRQLVAAIRFFSSPVAVDPLPPIIDRVVTLDGSAKWAAFATAVADTEPECRSTLSALG